MTTDTKTLARLDKRSLADLLADAQRAQAALVERLEEDQEPRAQALLAGLRRAESLTSQLAAAGGGEPPCLYDPAARAVLELRSRRGDPLAAEILERMIPAPVPDRHQVRVTVPAVTKHDCLRCASNLCHPVGERNGRPVYGDCPGKRIQRGAQVLNEAGLPARYADAVTTHVTPIVEDVRRGNWRPGDRGWWLWGNPGTGKTHALVAASRMLMQRHGVSVRWVRMPDLLAQIRRSYAKGWDGPSERDLLTPLEDADLLILDEFASPSQGIAKGSAWQPKGHELRITTELIDARYDRAGVTTWLTSNLSPHDIAKVQTWQSSRMMSRLSDESLVRRLQVTGRDRRRPVPAEERSHG